MGEIGGHGLVTRSLDRLFVRLLNITGQDAANRHKALFIETLTNIKCALAKESPEWLLKI